jgi:RNA recognition motif-containing protein
MLKMFIGNLPPEATETSVRAMFSEFGTVRSIDVARDLFNGRCKGFGFVEMEGHEARAALAALDGRTLPGAEQGLRVRIEDPHMKRGGRRR